LKEVSGHGDDTERQQRRIANKWGFRVPRRSCGSFWQVTPGVTEFNSVLGSLRLNEWAWLGK